MILTDEEIADIYCSIAQSTSCDIAYARAVEAAVMKKVEAKAVAAEREACAVICENMEPDDHGRLSREDFAEAIRHRSKK